MMAMPFGGLKREQQSLLLIAGVAVALVAAHWMLIGSPLWRALQAQRQEFGLAKTKLEHMEQVVSQEAGLRRRLQNVQESMEQLHAAMPAEATLPAVIERLSEMATRSGLKIQTIFPQRSADSRQRVEEEKPEGADLYNEVPIQVDALAGFHQLGQFISSVEHHTQPMRLKNLRVTGHPKEARRHNVKMVLLAYFATSEVTRVGAASASTDASQP